MDEQHQRAPRFTVFAGRRFAPTPPTPAGIRTPFSPAAISLWQPAARDAIIEGQNFLARYYNRSYEAIAKAMLCVTGSWDEVVDRLEAFREAGARTVVLRFAADDQLRYLETCADALKHRGLMR